MKREIILKIIGIISIIYGVIYGSFLFVIWAMTAWQASGWLLYLVTFATAIIPLTFLVGGIGLLTHKNWARILLIIILIWLIIKSIMNLPDVFNHTIGLLYFAGKEFLKLGVAILVLIIIWSKKTKEIMTQKSNIQGL